MLLVQYILLTSYRYSRHHNYNYILLTIVVFAVLVVFNMVLGKGTSKGKKIQGPVLLVDVGEPLSDTNLCPMHFIYNEQNYSCKINKDARSEIERRLGTVVKAEWMLVHYDNFGECIVDFKLI